MTTTPVTPTIEAGSQEGPRPASWPASRNSFASTSSVASTRSSVQTALHGDPVKSSGRDALQALLAFSALHQQVRQRRALAARHKGFETLAHHSEFEASEQFVLDEVLQLVAERAVSITGADGLGIALAENNEIVLRASAGTIKPDVGARIQRDSAFSGACFRTAQIIRCDDAETDERVNLYACRQLGARSMVAVPLCGRRRVIGLLQAFSAEPFGFNDSDVCSLELLAELILGALKPEDEDRFAESAEVAEAELVSPVAEAPKAVVAKQAVVANPTPTTFVKVSGKTEAPVAAAALIEQAVEAATVVPDLPSASPQIGSKFESKIEPKTESKIESKAESKIETESFVASAEVSVAPETALTESAAEPELASGASWTVWSLALVVATVLLGAGVWWKLSNSQLGRMMIKPEAKMAAKPASVASTISSPSSSVPAVVPATSGLDSHDNSTLTSESSEETHSDGSSAQDVSPRNSSKLPRVTGIRHWSSADSSTVVLDLEDQVQYEAHRLANPDRIYFDLHDTSLASELEAKTIEVGDPLLARVRVAQPTPGLTRVVLETKGNSDYSVSLEPSPYRLVVQVYKTGANTKSQVNLFPGQAEREKMAIVVPPPTHEDLQLRAQVRKMKIVVDAGHGGWDLGTVGKHGLLEKDLVLEIAQRLGKLLESRLGADVILTRKDDNYIPLDERAGMANQSQANLFVSVHANYSDLPSARGVETYYTNSFSSPSAKDLETRSANIKNVATTSLSPTDLHDRIEQSRRLAVSVERSLYGVLSAQNPGLRDRGVKEASYVVLTETAMPGILAEVSFVSSPTDEQKLRSDGYREEIAEALYKGIAKYAATQRGVKMASR